MLPFISVVIPVRNERAMLPALIDELMKQNYAGDRYELIVVDGRSTDGTADLVRRRYSAKPIRLRILDNPKVRSSAGRNLGIRAAAGNVILFLDGHCTLPSRNFLEDTAAILAQTGADCLCRWQPLLAPAPTPTGEAIAQARGHWLGHAADPPACDGRSRGWVDPVQGAAIYRREVFERVGLFDESFDGCEDLEFNARVRDAGLRAYADPHLAVHLQPREDVPSLLRQMVRNGRARLRLTRRHPEAEFRSQWAPVAILAALALLAPAWLLLPRPAAVAASVPAALFAAVVLASALQLGWRHGFFAAWKSPWVFTAIYCGLGAGLLLEALRPAAAEAAPVLAPAQGAAVVSARAAEIPPSLAPAVAEQMDRAA